MSPPSSFVVEQSINRAPIVCFAKGLDGRYLYANDYCLKVLGLTREQLLGHTDLELFPEAVARTFMRDDQRAIREGKTFELLERVPLATGEVRVSHTAKFPLYEGGEVFGVGALAFDVTEREHALAELALSEQRFRSVVDHSPTAYVAFDPASGHFVHANERAAQLFELPLEGLLTQSPASVSPALQPDGRSSELLAREHLAAALRGERRVFEWTHQTSQGEAVPCHVWIDRIEESGRLLARAFIVDLREINAARRELDRRQAQLTRTQQLALVGGWELDFATGAIRATGAAEEVFSTHSGMTDLRQRLPAAARDQLDAALREVKAGHKFDLELDLDVATGPRVLRLVGEPRRENGEVVGVTGWLQDVSQRRALEAQLRQSSKLDAVGRLAGGVAHDFNNMMGAVLAATSVLELELAGASPRVKEALDTITRAGQQAASLTRQLLAFSRQQPTRREPVVLDELVRDALQLLGRTLDRRITLEHRPAPEPALVEADPTSLENVLINLGINARDAMPGGGTLTFTTARVTLDDARARTLGSNLAAGDWITVAVRDTGSGIPPELLQRVFEPFFTTKEVGQGTGLGLATAYATLREHRGELTVESRPGEGTVFTLWIPPSQQVPKVVSPPKEERRRKFGVVLVVDDEPLVRRATGRFLEMLGFTVLDAADGVQAEAVLKAAPRVDLVLLDVMMPGRPVEATLLALRAVNPELPVLLCSGYAPDDVAQRVLGLPRVGHLQKPWSERELDAALATLRA